MLLELTNGMVDDFGTLVFYIGITMAVMLAHRMSGHMSIRLQPYQTSDWCRFYGADHRKPDTKKPLEQPAAIFNWLARLTMRKDTPDDEGDSHPCMHSAEQTVCLLQGGIFHCSALYSPNIKSTFHYSLS